MSDVRISITEMKYKGIHMTQSITTKDRELVECLNAHPSLRVHVEELLHIVEDSSGNFEKADAVEQQVIKEVRKIGHAALTEWANSKNEQLEKEFKEQPGIRLAGKKTAVEKYL
jgi:hypothetical protein